MGYVGATLAVARFIDNYTDSLYLLVIGSLLSRPNARVVIFTPGGAWRRLYSLMSTRRMTRSTVFLSKPRARISLKVRSSSTLLLTKCWKQITLRNRNTQTQQCSCKGLNVLMEILAFATLV